MDALDYRMLCFHSRSIHKTIHCVLGQKEIEDSLTLDTFQQKTRLLNSLLGTMETIHHLRMLDSMRLV
mgnify:CR=1 FL=1